uniref:Uncharacterized protein n=1 Tax=Avena sativa TaxID=4498 RepID=A0ACD6A360_AVESA
MDRFRSARWRLPYLSPGRVRLRLPANSPPRLCSRPAPVGTPAAPRQTLAAHRVTGAALGVAGWALCVPPRPPGFPCRLHTCLGSPPVPLPHARRHLHLHSSSSLESIEKQDELSIRPATMAGLPRIAPNPLSIGLPEEIFGFEILVRLSPKDLLRCRAVCRLASTRDFLLAHHLHQPFLPLVLVFKQTWGDIRSFDRRAAAAAAQDRLQPVVRIDDSTAIRVQASSYGLLLLLSVCTAISASSYRLLLRMRGWYSEIQPCYVFALGCNQLRPRSIGRSPEQAGFFDAPVLVSGNLHWSWWPLPMKKDQSKKTITVFDTTAESFRLMRGPVIQTSTAYLYEVDGTLGIYGCNDSVTAVDIWVMQDYVTEVWSHKYHVKLPVAEIREREGRDVIVVHEERDVFVAYKFEKNGVSC